MFVDAQNIFDLGDPKDGVGRLRPGDRASLELVMTAPLPHVTLGPAGEIIRLAGAVGERLKPQVDAGLRQILAPFVRANGVWAPSSTWFITARNPAGDG